MSITYIIQHVHAFLTPAVPNLPPGPDVLIISPDNSISIEDVRAIRHFLSRKPSQSDQNTVIIQSAEKLTLPAQHALLKTLEEPPGNSLIYLITSYPDLLLPTILSRVQIIDHLEHLVLPDNPQIPKFVNAEVGERLKTLDAQNFTREQALEFLNSLELYWQSHLNLNLDYQVLADTRKYLKANCSIKLALDHLALNLHTPHH